MNLSPTGVSSQQLNQVIQSHQQVQQLVAMTALGGPAMWSTEKFPSARLAENYKKFIETLQLQQNSKDFQRSLPFDFKFPGAGAGRLSLPIHPTPFVFTADTQSEQCDVKLEGESIPCFQIGGEKRLCLPQILKTVWAQFNLATINQACDELHIYCSRCNPEQLASFKRSGSLPTPATTCGLITMTDAERLCSVLLHGSTTVPVEEKRPNQHINEACIPVYHECFGEGYGYMKSDLYSSPEANCIECAECGQYLSTRQFVGHCHSGEESRICHWGFDRNNWRSYLMVDADTLDEAESSRLEFAFKDIISRFSADRVQSPLRKRKESECSSEPQMLSPEPTAKSRRTSDTTAADSGSVRPTSWLASPTRIPFPTAAMPYWPTNSLPLVNHPTEQIVTSQLSSPPPTLQNPENVVRSSETSRYEKHFIPNVALQQQSDVQSEYSKDQYEGKEEGNSSTDKSEDADSKQMVGRQLQVMDCVYQMESLFMKVLDTSPVDSDERQIWHEKYTSYSDSIRKCVVSPTFGS